MPKARKIVAILFENNLLLKSQQSLIKGAWAFWQLVAALTVSHPGGRGPVLTLERSGFGPRSAS